MFVVGHHNGKPKLKINKNIVVDTYKMLELRRKNNMYLDNEDTFDEQMEGFGNLIKEFIEIMSDYFNKEE